MDKTHSRYGDLLDKAMRKKEDRMLASAKNKKHKKNSGVSLKKNLIG